MSDQPTRRSGRIWSEQDVYSERQAPVREQGGLHDDYKESHPAYATIGASRVSHGGGPNGGAILFGSDFAHQHYMTVRIMEADLNRGLSSDRVFGKREYIEVALSESQWATFVSTPNVGFGVPCTLTYRAPGGEGQVPAIVPNVNRREQFRGEVDANLQTALATLREIAAEAPSKKLRDKAERAIRELDGNLDFVVERFDEHAEQTIEKAKAEVEAYLNAAITRAGLQALGAPSEPLLELIEGDEPR